MKLNAQFPATGRISPYEVEAKLKQTLAPMFKKYRELIEQGKCIPFEQAFCELADMAEEAHAALSPKEERELFAFMLAFLAMETAQQKAHVAVVVCPH